jgi:hypothetical protein
VKIGGIGKKGGCNSGKLGKWSVVITATPHAFLNSDASIPHSAGKSGKEIIFTARLYQSFRHYD